MSESLLLAVFLIVPAIVGKLALLYCVFRSYRKRNRKPGTLVLFSTGIASVVLMLLLALIGGEAYYRFVFDSTDALACTKLSQRWTDRYFKLNDAGFRDDVRYRRSLAPGLRRISILGDSFTAGHGVKRIEDRFANLVRAAHPEWEIHILAKPGSDTGTEIERLQGLMEVQYPLDTVLLVYCLNDVADLYPEWTSTIGRIYEDPRQRNWLIRNSYFMDLLYNRRRIAREPLASNYYEFVRDGYRGEKWEQQKQRLTAICDLVRTNHGTLLVATFPFLHKLGDKYEYQFAHDELNRFWTEKGVPHLDLLSAFSNEPPSRLIVSRNDPHPNEYAHRIAAERLEVFLRTNLPALN